jgi:hypothetical protein
MFFQQHPMRHKPLIDYHLALVLQPLSLGGTLVGVILNIMFPNWLLLLLLVVVLVISLERTVVKGIKMWKEEKRASMILDFDFKSEGIYQRIREEDWRLNTEHEELGSILNTERKTPLAPFLCMFLVLGVTTIFSLLKGSNKGSSIIGVKSCSPAYWILSFSPLPFLVIVTAVIAYTIIKMHIRKQACGYNFKVHFISIKIVAENS